MPPKKALSLSLSSDVPLQPASQDQRRSKKNQVMLMHAMAAASASSSPSSESGEKPRTAGSPFPDDAQDSPLARQFFSLRSAVSIDLARFVQWRQSSQEALTLCQQKLKLYADLQRLVDLIGTEMDRYVGECFPEARQPVKRFLLEMSGLRVNKSESGAAKACSRFDLNKQLDIYEPAIRVLFEEPLPEQAFERRRDSVARYPHLAASFNKWEGSFKKREFLGILRFAHVYPDTQMGAEADEFSKEYISAFVNLFGDRLDNTFVPLPREWEMLDMSDFSSTMLQKLYAIFALNLLFIYVGGHLLFHLRTQLITEYAQKFSPDEIKSTEAYRAEALIDALAERCQIRPELLPFPSEEYEAVLGSIYNILQTVETVKRYGVKLNDGFLQHIHQTLSGFANLFEQNKPAAAAAVGRQTDALLDCIDQEIVSASGASSPPPEDPKRFFLGILTEVLGSLPLATPSLLNAEGASGSSSPPSSPPAAILLRGRPDALWSSPVGDGDPSIPVASADDYPFTPPGPVPGAMGT